MMTPILNVMGRSRNARDWYFFSCTISLIMVLKTPTLPFVAPPRTRKKRASRKEVENPKPTQEMPDGGWLVYP
jgi:hypothetical protein